MSDVKGASKLPMRPVNIAMPIPWLLHIVTIMSATVLKFVKPKTQSHSYTNYSRWQLRCIATWGRQTPRQSYFTWITTREVAQPIHRSLKAFFAAETLRYDVILTVDSVTLTFDLWSLIFDNEYFSMLVVPRSISVLNLSATIDFNIWPNDLERVTRVALAFVIIFTKFELGHPKPNCSWFTAVFCWLYIMSHYDLGLCPLDLETMWYIVCHVLIIRSKFEWNWTIPAELLKIRPPIGMSERLKLYRWWWTFFSFFFYQSTVLSSRAVDGHQMYFGGSVVGKALLIDPEISSTSPPLIFAGSKSAKFGVVFNITQL